MLGRTNAALVGMADGTARLWDLSHGQLTRSVVACENDVAVSSVAVSADDRLAAVGCITGTVALWDLATGRRERVVVEPGGSAYWTLVRFTPEGRRRVVVRDDQVTVWDVPGAQVVRRFEVTPGQAINLAIHRDGRRIAVGHRDAMTLWDLQTGANIRTLPNLSQRGDHLMRGIAFSPDGRLMQGLRLWDVDTGNEHGAFGTRCRPAGHSFCEGATFSPDGAVVATGSGRDIALADTATGVPGLRLVGHSGRVTALTYSADGRVLVSGSEDGAVKLWDARTGKEMLSLFGLGRTDFVAVTPDQYYRASKGAAKDIAFRVRGRLFPFEQFDLRFNRPDIVMERLGAPADTLRSYRSAYERRLRKMGFTEEMLGTDFHVPEIEIVTADVPTSIAAAALTLRVRASDSRYPLDRLQTYVNDVPVHGTRGLALRERNVQSHEQDVEVPLLPGRNKIQVSVLNRQGTESLRRTVYTTSTAQVPPADVYVLAIGVSRYQARGYDLRFAAKDAADVLAVYRAAQGSSPRWGSVHALALTDRQATRAGIAEAKGWLARSRPNDLVVVFAAGHGMVDAQSNYYFGTYDIDPADPASRGLPYDEFESLLDGVPALQKLLLLDTCFSGEIDKDQPVVVAAASGTRGPTVSMRAFKAARGVAVVADSAENAAGGTTLSAAMLGFQQDWFADLRRGTGASVISSSSGNEYSLEGEQWRNGVFTYALLKGLKGGAGAKQSGLVKVSELQAYVVEQVRALTQGGQNPTVRRENLEHDFAVY